MQLSENTLNVLKNYSAINSGLYFKQGNTLRTVNPGKTILSEATIDETIPADFGVFELNQLLAIFSLHKTAPDVQLKGTNLVIQGLDGRNKITYRTCASDMIKTPPEKNIALPTEDVSFLLSEEDFNWIMKTSAVLASPNITVTGRDGKLYLGTMDTADDSAHTNALEVDNYTGDPVFFVFKTENWKMLPGAYKVTISSKGVAHFENQSRKLQYWVALESKKP